MAESPRAGGGEPGAPLRYEIGCPASRPDPALRSSDLGSGVCFRTLRHSLRAPVSPARRTVSRSAFSLPRRLLPAFESMSPSEPIVVLLDYDNVPAALRGDDLPAFVRRVLSALPRAVLPDGAHARCRLYGGWYEEDRLSGRARDLADAIRDAFPSDLRFPSPEGTRTVPVFVELALSMSIDERLHLFHTYRPRGAPRGLAPRRLPFAGCARPGECPLVPAHHLLAHGNCPALSCEVAPSEVFRRAEQKLVDTMLTADLIHAARGGRAQVAVVTNDDDLWPGIYTVVKQGAQVHHLRPVRRKAWPYAAALSAGYAEYSIPLPGS